MIVGQGALRRFESVPTVEEAGSLIEKLRESLNEVIRGKTEATDLLIVGLLSGGHVLIEDVPGVGKTTLAKALARSLHMEFSRVQFTPDLLPADILGSSVLDPQRGSFTFQEGPVFSHLLLADEINRASPRTQSALLEAMNEGHVTIDGMTRPLPSPFFVVATQNPVDYQGTYPLPEAQLDRFLLRVDIGYPDEDDEIDILFARQHSDPLDSVEQVATLEGLIEVQARVRAVKVDHDVARYLLRLVRVTRTNRDLEVGVSPRGALALFRASQARALMSGRDWVGPADIQSLARPVLEHRLVMTSQARYSGRTTGDIISSIVAAQDVPT
jgi:MoxR-like ATPase